MIERNKSFYKTFFLMTGALAGQNLLTFSVNLADNLMLGAYSETALSGAALVNQLQFLLQMLVAGVSEAVVVLGSQYWGKRQIDPIRRIASVGVWSSAAIGLLMFGATLLFPVSILRLLTPDAAVIAEGIEYLRFIGFTFVLFAVTNVLIASLRSVEVVRIGLLTSLSSLVINVILNYILIFGKLGFPAMGVRGAAIATLISRVAELGIIVYYIRARDTRLRLNIADLRKPDRSYLKDFYRVATPVILANAVWGVNLFIQTAILGRLGAASIAANSIASAIFQILTVITFGASNAAGVIIGKTVGSGNFEEVKSYARTMQLLFLGIGIVTGAAMFLSRDLILGFYAISDSTRLLARQFLTVLSVTVVGTSYQASVLIGIVRGGGNTRFVLYNDAIFVWLVVLPSAALAAFVFHLSPVAVFACLKCDQILKCAVAVVKVNRYDWMKSVTRS